MPIRIAAGRRRRTFLLRFRNGLGTDGGAVQRLPQRQEKRRDDALDRARPRCGRAVSLPRRGARALGHHDRAPKVLHDRGDGRKQAHDRGGPGVRHRAARGRGRVLDPVSRRAFARHQPALGDQRHRGRSATHRRRRPRADLRDDRTRRQGCAVRARGPARAEAVSLVAAARPGPLHQRRPGVRAFRPRLSRGNAFLPHVRRRRHTPSHAGRDRDGRGNRPASNARLGEIEHDFPLATQQLLFRRSKMKTYLALAIAGLSLQAVSAAQAQSPQQPPSYQFEAEQRAGIEEVLKSYERSLNASDVAGVVQLYTDDAVLLAPEAPSAVGIEAVRNAYTGIFQAIALNITFEIAEVKLLSPEWAFLRSNSKGVVKILANGAQVPGGSQELFVLHKSQGRWKIARYSFSSGLQPAKKSEASRLRRGHKQL